MSQNPPVTVSDVRDKARFEAVDESGVIAGFAAYRREGDRVVFTHTEVDDAFEGRGVGSLLVREALETVRGEGLHVVAQCPFVREYVERHPEYADLAD